MEGQHNVLFNLFLFYNCEQRNWITLFLIFYEICGENLKFSTQRYMGSTSRVNEHIQNTQ